MDVESQEIFYKVFNLKRFFLIYPFANKSDGFILCTNIDLSSFLLTRKTIKMV